MTVNLSYFKKPYRLDMNKNGGGIMICQTRYPKKGNQKIFVEINQRKNNFCLQVYIILNIKIMKQLILISLNRSAQAITNFYSQGISTSRKESTCFRNSENPIDLFLTNSDESFVNTTTVSTRLDCHKITISHSVKT